MPLTPSLRRSADDITQPEISRRVTKRLALIAVLAGPPAGAQMVTNVADPVICPACKITEANRIVLVGSGDEVTIDARPSVVRVDGMGRFWVFQEGALPIVFSPQGRSPRYVGRKGAGPGEFTSAYDMLAVPRDSVVVFDDRTFRATVLDPSLRAVRSFPMPVRVHSVALLQWPGSVIANAVSRTAQGASHSLHQLAFGNDQVMTLRTFGPANNELVPHVAGIVQQHLASTPDGRVWSAGVTGYNLYEWNASGTLQRTLRRRPPWFADVHATSIGSPTTPPKPALAGVAVDREGLLWVYTYVPASTWKAAWPPLPPGTREVRTRDIGWHVLFDTMIEVIDPRLKRVVARLRHEGSVVNALPGRRAAFYQVDRQGGIRVPIVTFELTGRSER